LGRQPRSLCHRGDRQRNRICKKQQPAGRAGGLHARSSNVGA
jgi:hypothetical protein